jgi:tyrosyl-tRNA synthetase
MDLKKKIDLIKRSTEEIIQENELREILKKKKPILYIGYAPTGRMHIGHFIPIVKIADFIKAGFKLKFLIADLHAFLDDKKSPWELLELRSKYYEEVIKGFFDAVKVDLKNVEFVRGSKFQLGKDYMLDVLHLAGEITVNRSKRAASEVVRFKEDPKLGGFIYPIMQLLDPVYLDVDVCYSGVDQRGIYMLGREVLPGLKKRTLTCVFSPLLPGLSGGKMSASDEKSKIDVLDKEGDVINKIKKAYCPAKEINDNGVMMFVKYVIFLMKDEFKIERDKKYGGDVLYKNYSDLERDYKSGKLHPMDLKLAVGREINDVLKFVRNRFKNKMDLVKKAYS